MNTKLSKKLAKSLEKLPISVGRILLWLVYKGYKPLVSIVLDFDWKNNTKKQKIIFSWLKEAGLKSSLSQKFPDTLHISRSDKLLELYKKYELKDSSNAHTIRGNLYGFPKEVVTSYAKHFSHLEKFMTHAILVEESIDWYWLPYAEYLVRIGYEKKDTEIAKKWADASRKDIPKLAKEYEKNRLNDLLELKRSLQTK